VDHRRSTNGKESSNPVGWSSRHSTAATAASRVALGNRTILENISVTNARATGIESDNGDLVLANVYVENTSGIGLDVWRRLSFTAPSGLASGAATTDITASGS
jgi:hypothetical protein